MCADRGSHAPRAPTCCLADLVRFALGGDARDMECAPPGSRVDALQCIFAPLEGNVLRAYITVYCSVVSIAMFCRVASRRPMSGQLRHANLGGVTRCLHKQSAAVAKRTVHRREHTRLRRWHSLLHRALFRVRRTMSVGSPILTSSDGVVVRSMSVR